MGGTNDDSNLIAACHKCNNTKKNKTAEGFRLWLRDAMRKDLDRIRLLSDTHVATFDREGAYQLRPALRLLEAAIDKIQPRFYMDQLDKSGWR